MGTEMNETWRLPKRRRLPGSGGSHELEGAPANRRKRPSWVGTESGKPRLTALNLSVGMLLGERCLINPVQGVWPLLENWTSIWQRVGQEEGMRNRQESDRFPHSTICAMKDK